MVSVAPPEGVSRGLFDLTYIGSTLCDDDKTESPESRSRPRMRIQKVWWYGGGKSQTWQIRS